MKIFAIILCALLSLGLIASAVLYYSPQATAINAVVGATKDFAKRDEISPLYQMLKEGSLEFSASEVKQNDENLLEDSSLSGKIYFSKDAMMYENINIKLSNLLDISGNMYFSNDLIYIEEDTILNGAYGMKPKNFVSDLENSIYIDWGSFINAVINFFLVALVLFCIVRIFNRFRDNHREAAEKLRKKQKWGSSRLRKLSLTNCSTL